MDEPVAGVDYLVDYYAVLGVPRGASKDEIRAAYRELQKQYHPDRFQGIAPELMGQLERKAVLLNEAFEELDDDARRAAYDAKLAGWTKPISKDGHAIIDLGAEGFSMQRLMKTVGFNLVEYERKIDEQALAFSGFSPATFSFFRMQAAKEGGLPDDLRGPYVEQLKLRDTYLSLKEGMLWGPLGYMNYAPVPELDYEVQSQEALQDLREDAVRQTNEQVQLLASGGKTFLIAPPSMNVSENAQALASQLVAQVGGHVDAVAQLLEPIAKEREVLLKERFAIEAEVTYVPAQQPMMRKVILEAIKAGAGMRIAFEFKTATHAQSIEADGLQGPKTSEEWVAEGFSYVSFKPLSGIEVLSQFRRVLELHAEKLESK